MYINSDYYSTGFAFLLMENKTGYNFFISSKVKLFIFSKTNENLNGHEFSYGYFSYLKIIIVGHML